MQARFDVSAATIVRGSFIRTKWLLCAGLALSSVAVAEVNVTNDQTHVWGAPVIAVNPKNPDNILIGTLGIGYTKDCVAKAVKDTASPCAEMKVLPFSLGGGTVLTRPTGMITNVPGFTMAAAWVSFDRGRTWTRSAEVREGGNIPVFPIDRYRAEALSDTVGVTAASDGTFYIAWDATHFADVPGYTDFGGVPISKSTDGGRSWSHPMPTASGLDGGRLLSDQSTGTIYALGGGGNGRGPTSALDPAIRITRDAPRGNAPGTGGGGGGGRSIASSRDGATWTPPQRTGGGERSMDAAHGVVVTAFKTTDSRDYLGAAGRSPPNNELCGTAPAPCTVFQTTNNLGANWDRHVVAIPNSYAAQPVVAADPTTPGHFALAVALNSDRQIHVFQTRDSGRTWSKPMIVAGEAGRALYQPTLAFGPTGVLGLAWRSRPAAAAPTAPGPGQNPQIRAPFSVHAAISKDGTRFSRPMKLSSAESPAPPTDRPFALSRDSGTPIAVGGQDVFVAWPDWRTGEASVMFSAVKFAAFKP